MFAKKETMKKAAKKEASLENSDIKAFLGPGSQFEGKLHFDEIVRLDGSFRGEIVSKDILIVGETADIQAEVSVGSLVLSGRFKGNIKAVKKVELRAPANVEGSVEAPALIIEEGVVFNGSLVMKPGGAAAPVGNDTKTPIKA
jgi:cytoskeletal protein CcmA (bactofilin family)